MCVIPSRGRRVKFLAGSGLLAGMLLGWVQAAEPALTESPGMTNGVPAVVNGTIPAADPVPPRRPYSPPRMAQTFRLTTNAVESAALLGVDLARGNTESSAVRAGLELYGNRGVWFWEWMCDYSYAKSRDPRVEGSRSQPTADYASTVLTGRRRFGEAWYNAAELVARYDKLAGIDYRYVASTGIGRILREDTDYQLTVESGVAGVAERVDGRRDDWPALRFAQRFELRLPTGGLLREYVEWLPNPLDTDEYLIHADVSLELGVWRQMRLIASARNRYVSQPADDAESNDLRFSTQFKWIF